MSKRKIDPVLSEGYVLRSALRADDTAAVGRLIQSTGFFTAAEQMVAMELVTERLQKGAASGYEFWLVDCDHELAGYICYGPVPCTLASYDIYWIAVAPVQQGKGLGRLLMQHAETSIQHRGGKQIYIETSSRELYGSTRGFYLANAYREVSRLGDFYAPGDDRVTYAKVF